MTTRYLNPLPSCAPSLSLSMLLLSSLSVHWSPRRGSVRLSATKSLAAIMLNGTIKMMHMLSRPYHTKGAFTAQSGVDVEAPLDDGVFDGASGTRWRRDHGRGRSGSAVAGLGTLCVFAIVSCVDVNFLLIVLNVLCARLSFFLVGINTSLTIFPRVCRCPQL